MVHKSNRPTLILSLSIVVLLTTLCSCMADTRHITFASIDYTGWAQTDTLIYTIAPLNGAKRCGISLQIHTEGYRYKNISLGITIRQDSTLLYQELRNYLLEQNHPKNGIGHRYDYTLPIGNFTLCDTLPTAITVTQQLDQPTLVGIRKVGVHIASPMHEPGEPIWKVDWH